MTTPMAEEEDQEFRDAHTACEEGNLWSIQKFVKTSSTFDINAPDHTGRTWQGWPHFSSNVTLAETHR